MVDDFVENLRTLLRQSKILTAELIVDIVETKECCENLVQAVDSKTEIQDNLKRVFSECWSVEKRTVTQKGQCGENRSASGSTKYDFATLRSEKVTELNRLLSDQCSMEVDVQLCWEIHSKSLALQIQWKVIELGLAFVEEHKVSTSNPPSIVTYNNVSPSRENIRGALSDLFHYLRFHDISKKFRECAVGWITELTSYLFKCATADDQLFLLCHVLHVPSPVDTWAPQLIQTYISHPSLDVRSTIDNFVALLSLLLSPISHRVTFLEHIKQQEQDVSSWELMDEDGKQESFVTINENDLIAILDQFCIQDFFKKAVMHFTAVNKPNTLRTFLSLVAMELILMKIFNEGLKTYNTERYKSFCRKIAFTMKQSVKDICLLWKISCDQFLGEQREIIQKEIDRIVVLMIYYTVSKQNIGMWQYLSSLPYETISEDCRLRCELPELIHLHPARVVRYEPCRRSCLIEKIGDVNNADCTYMLQTLAIVMSSSRKDPESFLRDIVHVCFLDESTREDYYKVGASAVSVLIDGKPTLLSPLLKLIDRNADNLGPYAIEILKASRQLSKCVLSIDDISIFGKWLINRPIDHPVSLIARAVIKSVNWGPVDHHGHLRIAKEVHIACAEAIVKGHIAQFKNQNGLISKSMQKAIKMWSKIPDMEQKFNDFCFDVLIRLKLPITHTSRTPSPDVTDYYVYLAQYCLSSADNFIDHGMPYFNQLVLSGCFTAAITILGRFVVAFPEATESLILKEAFRETFDILLHSDSSSYAVQLLVGADQFPGNNAKFLCNAITYSLVNDQNSSKQNIAFGWLRILCSKRSVDWNRDDTSLYLIGTIIDILLVVDAPSKSISSLVDFVESIYNESLKVYRENSSGILSFFMASNVPPPLIEKDQMKISPSAAFIFLKAEYQSYAPFYEQFYRSLGKNQSHTVEQVAKKASSKTNIELAPTRLYYNRLLELLCSKEAVESIVYTLVLQEFAIVMFSRKEFTGGERFFSCKSTHQLFVDYRDVVFPALQPKLPPKAERLCRSVLQWIFTNNSYSVNFSDFDSILDDYLLQLVFNNDLNVWSDFISGQEARKTAAANRKIFANVCDHDIMHETKSPDNDNNMTTIVQFLGYLSSKTTESRACPSVPAHPSLPPKRIYDEMSLSDSGGVLSTFEEKLGELLKATAVFADAKGKISDLDTVYIASIADKYTQSQTTLRIKLTCSDTFSQRTCGRPSEVEVIVAASHISPAVTAKMDSQVNQRQAEVSSIYAQLLDSMAVMCAHTESLADSLGDHYSSATLELRKKNLQETGKKLFCHMCNTINASNMLCMAATTSFEAIITLLGKAFMANVAKEQITLMNIVLSGNVLNYIIVENFTPDKVAPSDLFSIYKQLSIAVRNPEKSQSAKSLLKRLDIVNAGQRLPAEQYIQLLPVIFENIASIPENDSDLLQLCMDHFLHTMFHKFPHNLSAGLQMMLNGCDTKNTPKALFNMVMAQIGCGLGASLRSSANVKHHIPPEMVIHYIELLSRKLKFSRRELGPRLYTVWADYLEPVCRLAAYFIIVHVENTFHYERPPTAMENDLRDCFMKCTEIWGPLLEPIGPGTPPFNPADRVVAQQVIDRLVGLLLWLPHNKQLPREAENIETLFFQYFCDNLACLKNSGAAHVYSVYALEFVKLNWQMFLPTLMDIDKMEKLYCDPEFSEIHPLLTEIFVRIPWKDLQMQQQQMNQPNDALIGFYSLLFSILTRAISQESNYVRCRASMPRLLNALLTWYLVSQPFADKTTAFIAQILKPEWFFSPNEISKPFFGILRLVCWSSTVETTDVMIKVTRSEKAKKQSLFLRTQLQLLQRSTFESAEIMNKYKEIIKNANAIVSCYQVLLTFPFR
ncbi:hypothetical protein L596_002706 [Steinernema carpocapsae]|uniref:Uncharacterized protein n=1 Tax=Steinernema carpocapsae TaxID=34508 RepID=A0A4U8UU32_STECR|nr:hypothetical protein L596_002706 [Steinernema carpocapsae]